jgi:Tfp pilus assembly protein PilN
MTAIDFKKWLAVGAGIGMEIGREHLMVTAVRVRPSGVKVLGELTIHRFREQPATEWGAEYANFLKKLGLSHLAANVLLPRDEVMVRQLALPGVADKDLAAAIRFELDSLNPYSEEEAVFDWARVGKSPSILIGITRRTVLGHYTSLFAGAGIKVASFTFSAPAIYSALRLLSTPSSNGLLAVAQTEGELEVYGESPARPLFSARLDGTTQQARALAVAELRLPPETEPAVLHEVLPKPLATPTDYDASRSSLAYATALAGACPFRPLAVNLLPLEQRRTSSRLRYVPTLTLAALALLMLGAVVAYPKYADRHYLGLLHQEIRKLDPEAKKAADLDRQIALTRNRTQTLDNFRRHTKEDMDALNELTQMLAAPTWLNSLQLTRDSVTIAGETEQAAALIKLLDSSKQFRNSSFALPLQRSAAGELFSIRSSRREPSQ